MSAETYLVTHTGNDGAGSLRQAILDANAHPNDDEFTPDRIHFSIAAPGPYTISVSASLPAVTDPVNVDGSTQPGATTDPLIELDGTSAGAGADGLRISAGSSSVLGLVINRFSGAGIRLDTWGDNTVLGNYLGTDLTGASALGNGTGIAVDGGFGNALAGNLISGNAGPGILLANTADNRLLSNILGADATGAADLGNGGDGVRLENADANTIELCVIAFNGGRGINVVSGAGNLFSGNPILNNGGVGIDLGNDGVTANDAGDADTGANNLLNYPALTGAVTDGVHTTIDGSIAGLALTEFLLEFFVSDSCDPSGNGEGAATIGGEFVYTDGDGFAGFSASLPEATAAGQVITATATSLDEFGFPLETSEFSACQTVTVTGNQAPLAEPDQYQTTQDTPLAVEAATGVLANDTDPDGTPLSAVLVSGPAHAASFTLNANGSFSYTPAGGFAGSDVFVYQASDGAAQSLDTPVTLLVAALTPVGSNVTVRLTKQFLGIELELEVTFEEVLVTGETAIAPLDPAGFGQLPTGFDLFKDEVLDVSTTAVYAGPIAVCFKVPGVSDAELFELLRVLHEELGEWVDRTLLPADFDTGTLCAQVDSLSSFALAVLGPPVEPDRLRATTRSATRINLRWSDRSGNEDGFVIERKDGPAGAWAPLATVGANVYAYADLTVNESITYFYRVWAYNAAGTSLKANKASATPITSVAGPSSASGLTATALTTRKIRLQWVDESDNEAGFKIQRSSSPAGPWKTIGSVGANMKSFRDKRLEPGTTYYYRVRAYNPTSGSPPSNVAGATTLAD